MYSYVFLKHSSVFLILLQSFVFAAPGDALRFAAELLFVAVLLETLVAGEACVVSLPGVSFFCSFLLLAASALITSSVLAQYQNT